MRLETDVSVSKWLDFVLAQKNIPQTISTSYGDDEQTGKCFLRNASTQYNVFTCLQFLRISPDVLAPVLRNLAPEAFL